MNVALPQAPPHSYPSGKRWIYVSKPLTAKQRKKIWRQKLKLSLRFIRARIESDVDEELWMAGMVSAAEDFIAVAKTRAGSTKMVQEVVDPIDKRYKDAPLAEYSIST